MVKLVDTPDLGSGAARRGSSSLSTRTRATKRGNERFPRAVGIVERHFACQKATEFSKATAGKWTGGVLAITGRPV